MLVWFVNVDTFIYINRGCSAGTSGGKDGDGGGVSWDSAVIREHMCL